MRRLTVPAVTAKRRKTATGLGRHKKLETTEGSQGPGIRPGCVAFAWSRRRDLVKFIHTIAAAALAAAAFVAPASALDISGAGATFPYPIYAKWADAYKKETGSGLNYQSIGSGGGIKQIQAKTVTFGASDMPLKGEQL